MDNPEIHAPTKNTSAATNKPDTVNRLSKNSSNRYTLEHSLKLF
jgi:hypothetical protein